MNLSENLQDKLGTLTIPGGVFREGILLVTRRRRPGLGSAQAPNPVGVRLVLCPISPLMLLVACAVAAGILSPGLGRTLPFASGGIRRRLLAGWRMDAQ